MSAHCGSVSVVDATYLGVHQRHADGVGAHICDCSPGAGEDLVGPPADQEGVGALEVLLEKRRGDSLVGALCGHGSAGLPGLGAAVLAGLPARPVRARGQVHGLGLQLGSHRVVPAVQEPEQAHHGQDLNDLTVIEVTA